MGNEEVNINVGGRQYPLKKVVGRREDMWNVEEVLEETARSVVGFTSGEILDG